MSDIIVKKQNNSCDKYTTKILENKEHNLFIVFYMDTCPYSMGALNTLEAHKMSYKAYEIQRFPNDKLPKLFQCLTKTATETEFDLEFKTMPAIFHKGKFVGGFSDLKEKFNL
jgi:glutaredoxin